MTPADTHRLDRPVDPARDHILGAPQARITLVEYGSYDCPHCRAANRVIAALRDRFGDQLRYVFRHRPLTGSDLARRAAELVEQVAPERFWEAHMQLMDRSARLTESDLDAVAAEFGVAAGSGESAEGQSEPSRARERVEADERSARASGVRLTPTFFINGRRYFGSWDQSELADALVGSLGHRMRATALEFASWAPSAGLLLGLASVMAVLLTNSPLGPAFTAFWETRLGFTFGGESFSMSLLHWINDGLLTLFFLVVGLEIKREFTVGHLADRRSAAFPIAAALGGMAVPAVIYALIVPSGPWAHGWGIPMATDTAFAIALIAVLGRRVPVELRIFLTAAAIVDDIAAIGMVAVFYSEGQQWGWLLAGAGVIGGLALLNRMHIYRAGPYVLLGLALWACVYAGGLHATLAGVLLAIFIPTRPPPNYPALMAQADAILSAEAGHGKEVLRSGPSEPAMHALDDIHDRMESPAARMLRHAGTRSSYFVLPLFAFANAGVVLDVDVVDGHGLLMAAIIVALTFGKPIGMLVFCALAVRLRIADKPDAYSWSQLLGAGALAGIGFTMSLLIANQAFDDPSDFDAAKIAIFAASLLAAAIGTTVLWWAGRPLRTSDSAASSDHRAAG
ncbi:MAG: Na+/H+ antiporter NhaA [Lysobacter sp.]